MKDAVVIGGGLAGLTAAILLRRSGFTTVLIERKTYPFHRVCGEYISKEVAAFLVNNELDFRQLQPADIHTLHFSASSGADLKVRLNPGGYGLSRYAFDHFLFQKAQDCGVEVYQGTEVSEVSFMSDHFRINTRSGETFRGLCCIGAFGKRSVLDQRLNRNFMREKTGFVGVKMHYEAPYPDAQIGLHNFNGGYAGISMVEKNIANMCYMTHSETYRHTGSFEAFEKQVLCRNPHIREFLSDARPVFDKPLVISQMYFGVKAPVEDHLLMCGDAAGAIPPLTGNGMAMAIAAGKLAALTARPFIKGTISRDEMEKKYERAWLDLFKNRIRIGNIFQPLFGKKTVSGMAVKILKLHPRFLPALISLTHGQELE